LVDHLAGADEPLRELGGELVAHDLESGVHYFLLRRGVAWDEHEMPPARSL
jgi:hypothetical protein